MSYKRDLSPQIVDIDFLDRNILVYLEYEKEDWSVGYFNGFWYITGVEYKGREIYNLLSEKSLDYILDKSIKQLD